MDIMIVCTKPVTNSGGVPVHDGDACQLSLLPFLPVDRR